MAHDDQPLSLEEMTFLHQIDAQIDQGLRAPISAQPGQRGALDPDMLQALSDYYQPQAELTDQALDGVWARLEQRGVTAAQPGQRGAWADQPGRADAGQRPIRQPGPTPRPRRRWFTRLSTLVAAALLVALVGGLTAGLVLVHHGGNAPASGPTPQATPAITQTLPPTFAPTPSPTSASNPSGIFASVQMIDATNGWAITYTGSGQGGGKVLRTTDGGSHWQDVSPQPAVLVGGGEFLSASLAWIVEGGDNQINEITKAILGTTDGGKTWQRTPLVTGGPPLQLTFIDAQHGWLLADTIGGVSPTSQPDEVFRTTDGGASWVKTSDVVPAGTSHHPLPTDGVKSGLGFRDASTGWATGVSANYTTSIWLYVTHDGGYNWQPQTLALPPGAVSAQFFRSELPTFFSAQDGVLPVVYTVGSANNLAMYVTHDGGASWQSSIPVAFSGPGSGIIDTDFISADQGWATAGSTLFATSDGGQHWTRIATSAPFTQVSNLDFVSNTVGYALSGSSDAGSALLKTTDGGQTWTVISPTT